MVVLVLAVCIYSWIQSKLSLRLAGTHHRHPRVSCQQNWEGTGAGLRGGLKAVNNFWTQLSNKLNSKPLS